jgi:hypothetical protein
MPQSLSNVLQHIVFSTKHRQPLLRDPEARDVMTGYLVGTLRNLKCPSILTGAVEDHVHILCNLVVDCLSVDGDNDRTRPWRTEMVQLVRYPLNAGTTQSPVLPPPTDALLVVPQEKIGAAMLVLDSDCRRLPEWSGEGSRISRRGVGPNCVGLQGHCRDAKDPERGAPRGTRSRCRPPFFRAVPTESAAFASLRLSRLCGAPLGSQRVTWHSCKLGSSLRFGTAASLPIL